MPFIRVVVCFLSKFTLCIKYKILLLYFCSILKEEKHRQIVFVRRLSYFCSWDPGTEIHSFHKTYNPRTERDAIRETRNPKPIIFILYILFISFLSYFPTSFLCSILCLVFLKVCFVWLCYINVLFCMHFHCVYLFQMLHVHMY